MEKRQTNGAGSHASKRAQSVAPPPAAPSEEANPMQLAADAIADIADLAESSLKFAEQLAKDAKYDRVRTAKAVERITRHARQREEREAWVLCAAGALGSVPEDVAATSPAHAAAWAIEAAQEVMSARASLFAAQIAEQSTEDDAPAVVAAAAPPPATNGRA